jgi:hypothetical protein
MEYGFGLAYRVVVNDPEKVEILRTTTRRLNVIGYDHSPSYTSTLVN